MSSIQELPERLSEYESLISMSTYTLDAFPGAVYLCDSEGWVVRYNTEAARLWGRVPVIGRDGDRFCGSYQLFLLDGTPLPVDECPMAIAIKTGVETRNADVVLQRPDGSRLVALVNIRALRDRHGVIQGAINCFQDASAHHAMAQELVRKSDDLEDFFDNSAVGLHIVSGEGIIQRANKAELALLGYTAE